MLSLLIFSGNKTLSSLLTLFQEKDVVDSANLFRISKHWPEFGMMGKERITVADMLRHEGGLFTNQMMTGYADILIC